MQMPDMRTLIAAIIIALGILSSGSAASAAVSSDQPKAFSMLGVANVGGETVIVDVVVAVQPGQNAAEVARAALAAQGARPFESANLGSKGFTVTGLVWDVLPVVQNYNPGSPKTEDEPASLDGKGQTALTNTHTTWDAVGTSFFDIDSGGTTTRCPSLVRECKGPQKFDGNNDVAWLQLEGNVLGVTWFSSSIDEADIALNTAFSWNDGNDGCSDVANSFDAQTVFLHENGHVVGLRHSDDTDSVLQPVYHGADCTLGTDDEEGATYLYPTQLATVSGTVDDGTDPIVGATVVLEGTGLWATTGTGGDYTITDVVPYPVTYDITASHPDFESDTILRLTVSGATTANFALTAGGGGGGGGGTVGVSVSSISYATAGGKNGDKHLNITVAIVDNLGDPVSGAVEIDLFRDGSKIAADTGSTYPDNTVTFTLKNAPSGCYTTTVTYVATAELTWDGVTPPNEFPKGEGATCPPPP